VTVSQSVSGQASEYGSAWLFLGRIDECELVCEWSAKWMWVSAVVCRSGRWL